MLAASRSLGMALVATVVCACGGSGSAHHAKVKARASTVCTPRARAAIASSFSLPPAAIGFSESTGNNAMPQCSFSARLTDGKRVTVVANLDRAPSPYFRLERTAVEASQSFTPTPLSPPPASVLGLGLEADWFPAEKQLMTTDGLRLITVSFSWPGATQKQEQRVAEAVARPYLKKLSPKQAAAVVNGFPSG
ncbi:MAG: hypothetical protein ACR2L9_04560 [Solirubrobacteraceae bacterium]